jgi:hypothetical protein
MQWSDLPLSPTERLLRQFAGLWIAFFGGLAAWHWRLGHTGRATVFGTLAATVGPLGLLFPRAIKPVFVGWLVAAYPIGWLVTRVALLVLFYGVITPVGLIFRLTGRDSLGLRRRPERETYWTPKTMETDFSRYFRQF